MPTIRLTLAVLQTELKFICSQFHLHLHQISQQERKPTSVSADQSVVVEDSGNNPFLWDKKQVHDWVMSVIGNDKRCGKGDRVFTPMIGSFYFIFIIKLSF